MDPGALIYLLLAHFAADFPLQFQNIVKLRNDPDRKTSMLGNALHACIHLMLSLFSLVFFRSPAMLFIVAAIALLHFIIDMLKSKIISGRPFMKYSIYLFLADQAAHLIGIFLVFFTINRISSGWSFGEMFESIFLTYPTYGQRLLLSAVLLTAGLWGTGIFIKIVLGRMGLLPYKRAINLKIELVNSSKDRGAVDGGFLIGILERLFIIISIVLNMQLVIGFILTVKSVARLKKFDDERFVEIFIIGSFISFISAIAAGYLISLLHIIPAM